LVATDIFDGEDLPPLSDRHRAIVPDLLEPSSESGSCPCAPRGADNA
jgi:hypothetical protein